MPPWCNLESLATDFPTKGSSATVVGTRNLVVMISKVKVSYRIPAGVLCRLLGLAQKPMLRGIHGGN